MNTLSLMMYVHEELSTSACAVLTQHLRIATDVPALCPSVPGFSIRAARGRPVCAGSMPRGHHHNVRHSCVFCLALPHVPPKPHLLTHGGQDLMRSRSASHTWCTVWQFIVHRLPHDVPFFAHALALLSNLCCHPCMVYCLACTGSWTLLASPACPRRSHRRLSCVSDRLHVLCMLWGIRAVVCCACCAALGMKPSASFINNFSLLAVMCE